MMSHSNDHGPLCEIGSTASIVACTTIASNYLSYARVLADGWLAHHHRQPLVVLVIDDELPSGDDQRVRFVSTAALGLAASDIEQMRGMYELNELACALKPMLVRALLDAGAKCVIYVDPDLDIHSNIADVAELAMNSGIVLSPHTLRPIPDDGLSPSNLHRALHGTFNGGLIGVTHRDIGFVNWWASRTRWDSLFAEDLGMHADQRMLDQVPALFESAVLRDPGLNVAHWNLHERPLTRESGHWTAGGAEMRVFHFAGFDPMTPARITRYVEPDLLRRAAKAPEVARLSASYADKLLAAGFTESGSYMYRYGRTADGRPLEKWQRRIYRAALIAARRAGYEGEIPSPFDPSAVGEFAALIHRPEALGLIPREVLERDRRGADTR